MKSAQTGDTSPEPLAHHVRQPSARARLAELIAKAHVRQAKRIRTRPSRAAKAKRVDAKKERSAVKKARAKPRFD